MSLLPEELRFRAVGVLGLGVLGALFATLRVRRQGLEHLRPLRDRGDKVIFTFWHGRLLPLVHAHRGEGIVVLVSDHADGEYITRVIERHGFGTVRGSSTRGGVKGLKALVRAARAGHDLGLSPDGPRGPARRFKPGALVAAQITGLPILPLASGASSAWHFDSWDRFFVPRPFSTIQVAYGAPRWIPRDATESDLREAARDLEREMDRLVAACDGRSPEAAEVPDAPRR